MLKLLRKGVVPAGLARCSAVSECMEQSALCMRRTTTHTTDIAPLRAQPAAGGISLSANL